jgi:hypothetical protein
LLADFVASSTKTTLVFYYELCGCVVNPAYKAFRAVRKSSIL